MLDPDAFRLDGSNCESDKKGQQKVIPQIQRRRSGFLTESGKEKALHQDVRNLSIHSITALDSGEGLQSQFGNILYQ